MTYYRIFFLCTSHPDLNIKDKCDQLLHVIYHKTISYHHIINVLYCARPQTERERLFNNWEQLLDAYTEKQTQH